MERHEDIRFEPSDVSWRPTLLIGVCVIAGMWLLTGLLFFYFIALKDYRASVSPRPLAYEAHGEVTPPEPRLQASPHEDLKRYLERQNWELTHYHWVDRSKGVVAIPIEQAIEIIAKRGIPATNTPPNPTNTPPAEGTRDTGFSGTVEPEPR